MFPGYCRGIRQTLDERGGELSSRAREVRVALSSNMAQHVIKPSLPELVARRLRLTIDLLVNDALADIRRDGSDIAIRTGSAHTDEVIAKQISRHG